MISFTALLPSSRSSKGRIKRNYQLIKNLDMDIDDIKGIKVDTQRKIMPNFPKNYGLFLKRIQNGEVFTVQTKHSKFDAQVKKSVL